MTTQRLSTEIAHTLFMDIVGYSRLPMEEQMRLVRELRQVVQATPEYQAATQSGKFLSLDTGDGMALIFFGDPIQPAQCAVEIAAALREHARLPLRMGIHSGPISRERDMNGKENVIGDGINMAQRVMDSGTTGHILVSYSSAGFILPFEGWEACLHDLGECVVKHDKRLHLFNLHTADVGNPARPASLSHAVVRALPGGASAQKTAEKTKPKVALLYKRNAQPDETLLALLEKELTALGVQVFIDRHLTVGVEWAKEIERQVRSADAIIPLLSEAAIHSEMLTWELEEAHKAAQSQNGRPRLLPVRVNYEGALPDPMAAILTPLHYASWHGTQHDARLVSELVEALQNPPVPSPADSPIRLEPIGGAVPLDSEFYIARPADTQFKEALARQDSTVLIKGARQMGKTSLLARGLQQAREAGAKVIFTDLQMLNEAHLESPNAFFLALASAISDQLELNVSPRKIWDAEDGPNSNMERFLRRHVLSAFSEPVVWGLDEVDRLFSCAFGSEVFGLFRSWHNRRAFDPRGPWSRLTLAIAYATEAHLFITDLNQSPFNVGTPLALDDFTQEQVSELNRRYGSPLRNLDGLNRFYRLVNGHPYLVRRGLDEMTLRPLDITRLEAQADQEEGLYGDHLRRLLVSLSKDQELTAVVRDLLRGGTCPSSESLYRLRSAGVVSGSTAQEARMRCPLYTAYLSRHLL